MLVPYDGDDPGVGVLDVVPRRQASEQEQDCLLRKILSFVCGGSATVGPRRENRLFQELGDISVRQLPVKTHHRVSC